MSTLLKKYIVVIECTDAGGIEIGMAILRMGYKPLFLLSTDTYKADVAFFLQNFEFLSIDTSNKIAILAYLASIKTNIAGITTLVDSRLAITAQLAQELEIPGPDPVCIALKDKVQVASFAHEYSSKIFEVNKKHNKNNILNQIDVFFDQKTIVAKQRAGCGAVGLEFLTTKKEKQDFIEKTDHLDNWIFQEYIEGALFSLEGWVSKGNIVFIGWTSRRKINNTETEFRFEGFQTMPGIITSYAQEAIRNLFIRSDYKKGWFHIEFLIDEARSRVVMIDANVGRTGGAMLPHVLAMALSLQPVEIYQHAIEVQIFGQSNIPLDIAKIKENSNEIYKCICFGSPQEIIIQQIILPQVPLETSGLRIVRILGAGDHVSKMGHDDWSWIGFVAGKEKMVDRYAACIQIKSEEGLVYTAAF